MQGHREKTLLDAIQAERGAILSSIQLTTELSVAAGDEVVSALKASHYLFKVVLRDFVALCDRLVKTRCFLPDFKAADSVSRLQSALSLDDFKLV